MLIDVELFCHPKPSKFNIYCRVGKLLGRWLGSWRHLPQPPSIPAAVLLLAAAFSPAARSLLPAATARCAAGCRFAVLACSASAVSLPAAARCCCLPLLTSAVARCRLPLPPPSCWLSCRCSPLPRCCVCSAALPPLPLRCLAAVVVVVWLLSRTDAPIDCGDGR